MAVSMLLLIIKISVPLSRLLPFSWTPRWTTSSGVNAGCSLQVASKTWRRMEIRSVKGEVGGHRGRNERGWKRGPVGALAVVLLYVLISSRVCQQKCENINLTYHTCSIIIWYCMKEFAINLKCLIKHRGAKVWAHYLLMITKYCNIL